MADVRFDATGLTALAGNLRKLSATAEPQARAIVARAGMNMKADMRAEAQSPSDRFKRVQYSINFDLTDKGMGVEVGPDITLPGKWQKQGRLAWVAYNGTSDMGPVFPDPAGVLEREALVAAKFLAALGDL